MQKHPSKNTRSYQEGACKGKSRACRNTQAKTLAPTRTDLQRKIESMQKHPSKNTRSYKKGLAAEKIEIIRELNPDFRPLTANC